MPGTPASGAGLADGVEPLARLPIELSLLPSVQQVLALLQRGQPAVLAAGVGDSSPPLDGAGRTALKRALESGSMVLHVQGEAREVSVACWFIEGELDLAFAHRRTLSQTGAPATGLPGVLIRHEASASVESLTHSIYSTYGFSVDMQAMHSVREDMLALNSSLRVKRQLAVSKSTS